MLDHTHRVLSLRLVSSTGWLDLNSGPRLSCCNSGTAASFSTNMSCLVAEVVTGLSGLEVRPPVAAAGFGSSIAAAGTVFMSNGLLAAAWFRVYACRDFSRLETETVRLFRMY